METQAFFTEAEAAAFCRANGLPVAYERSGVAFVVEIPTIEGKAVEIVPTVESDEPVALQVTSVAENIGESTFTHTNDDGSDATKPAKKKS